MILLFLLSNWLLKIVLLSIGMFAFGQFVTDVKVSNFVSALFAVLLVSVLNATLGTVVNWFTAPINILTLGLFRFVVTAAIIFLTTYYVKGFRVKSFTGALALSVIMTVAGALIDWLLQ